MYKDHRYEIVCHNLLAGKIKTLQDIFKYIPIEVAAIDMGIDPKTLKRRLREPDGFHLSEVFELYQRIDPTIETYRRVVALIIQGSHMSGAGQKKIDGKNKR